LLGHSLVCDKIVTSIDSLKITGANGDLCCPRFLCEYRGKCPGCHCPGCPGGVDTYAFAIEYLSMVISETVREWLDSRGPPIGNGLCVIEWSRDSDDVT